MKEATGVCGSCKEDKLVTPKNAGRQKHARLHCANGTEKVRGFHQREEKALLGTSDGADFKGEKR